MNVDTLFDNSNKRFFKSEQSDLIKDVMIQLPQNHVSSLQATNLQHLLFENKLLVERNQLLSRENQTLLQELSKCRNQLQHNQQYGGSKIIDQLEPLMKIAQGQLVKNLESLGSELQSKIKVPLFRLKKERIETKSTEISEFCETLVIIIEKLAEAYQQLKAQKSKKWLLEKEERLAARKTAKDRTQKLVHIVKEPTEAINGISSKYLMQDIAQQRQFFEKLVKKTKKESVPSKAIQAIYEKFDETNTIRAALRGNESKLSLLERQFELGFLDPLGLNETIERIKQLGCELSSSKKKLQELLQHL